MKKGIWTKVLAESADPQQAGHFLKLLEATAASPALLTFSAEQARVLASLLSGSKALATLLVSHPEWLGLLDPESLSHPRRKQGMQAEAQARGFAYITLDALFAAPGVRTPFNAVALMTAPQPFGPYVGLDGLHPNAAGQSLIAAAAAQALNAKYDLGIPVP